MKWSTVFTCTAMAFFVMSGIFNSIDSKYMKVFTFGFGLLMLVYLGDALRRDS